MTNDEMVERLERLQDLLSASVTNAGAEGDGQEYEAIRNELLEVAELKAALPKLVHRIRSLSQFWGYIKTEQKELTSYASRRLFVADAFRPLLDSLREATPSTDGQKFFPKGSEHDAYTHIREILQQAQSSLLIIDGYMDASIYTVLSTLTGSVTIRMLTSKVPNDFALEGSKFVKQHSFTLEIRTARDFHDRFIVVDGKECYLLGASIKDAGARGFVVVPLRDGAVVEFFANYAEQVWGQATQIL